MEETGGLLQYEEWNQFCLMWKTRGMWGINKSEITLSVFSSNRKRATFGKVLLCQNCDPLWLSLGWKELGNEILSIYWPLFQYHTHHLWCLQLENPLFLKKKRIQCYFCVVVHCWFSTFIGNKQIKFHSLHKLICYLSYVSCVQSPGFTRNW